MASIQVTIVNKRGLHARASAKLTREAERFPAKSVISKDGVDVPATSIMGLMMLGAAKGDTITISSSGDQEAVALEALKALVENGFGESE
jgi:phosphocarrier protein